VLDGLEDPGLPHRGVELLVEAARGGVLVRVVAEVRLKDEGGREAFVLREVVRRVRPT
jgi:hypothetical protein